MIERTHRARKTTAATEAETVPRTPWLLTLGVLLLVACASNAATGACVSDPVTGATGLHDLLVVPIAETPWGAGPEQAVRVAHLYGDPARP